MIQPVFGTLRSAVYHGHVGVRRWQGDLEEAWGDEIRVEADLYFDLGDQVLAFDTLHGRGRQSGAEVALPGVTVTRWRAGRCLNFMAYADRDEALRELDVSENALQPIAP